MTICANESNKGKFNGLFWLIYMNSQIIGNLIAAFVLGNTNQLVYFGLMSGFALAGMIIFMFL